MIEFTSRACTPRAFPRDIIVARAMTGSLLRSPEVGSTCPSSEYPPCFMHDAQAGTWNSSLRTIGTAVRSG